MKSPEEIAMHEAAVKYLKENFSIRIDCVGENDYGDSFNVVKVELWYGDTIISKDESRMPNPPPTP